MAWPAGGISLTVKNLGNAAVRVGNGVLDADEKQIVTFQTLRDLKMAIKLKNDEKMEFIDELTQEIKDLLAAEGINPAPNGPPDTISMLSDLALQGDIKGTTQDIEFNTDGTVKKIQHKNKNNVVLREDVFTYATNIITEVRTLKTGMTMTLKYHLDTLQTEVI